MGINEHTIEKYLSKEIVARGGECRKCSYPGRKYAPDQLVLFNSKVYFVEVKTRDGKLASGQKREITRLSKLGMDARTIWGFYGVDEFIKEVADAKP